MVVLRRSTKTGAAVFFGTMLMRSALADSWYEFVEGAKDALVNAYAALPYIAVWVIVLGAAAVVVVLIVRGVRKKNRER